MYLPAVCEYTCSLLCGLAQVGTGLICVLVSAEVSGQFFSGPVFLLSLFDEMFELVRAVMCSTETVKQSILKVEILLQSQDD